VGVEVGEGVTAGVGVAVGSPPPQANPDTSAIPRINTIASLAIFIVYLHYLVVASILRGVSPVKIAD
jgi:hypothetical protein